MKKILIIGGAGYVGTPLANYLLSKFKVTVLDTFWFGNFLNKKIKKIKADIRNLKKIEFKKYDIVINLAYLSNDPLCEIDAKKTWDIGPLSNYYILEKCLKEKVKHYIFASSGSIYGLKKEKNVTEELGLDPITEYNKSKMICEKVINSYSDKIKTTILRPATVCGYSPRLRLDVVLNIFCFQAYYKNQITLFGGNQTRPLLHIQDMIRAYEFVINRKLVGTFNVGFQNMKTSTLARQVANYFNCKIKYLKSNDKRSYRMNSDKFLQAGFNPKFSSKNAILDLKNFFETKPNISDQNINLKWLKQKRVI